MTRRDLARVLPLLPYRTDAQWAALAPDHQVLLDRLRGLLPAPPDTEVTVSAAERRALAIMVQGFEEA